MTKTLWFKIVGSVLFTIVVATAVLAHMCRPVKIITDLSDGEIISHVELSKGKLCFKDSEVLLSQLTPDDFIEANGADYFNPIDDYAVPYYDINGGRRYDKNEILQMMNIYPEYWTVGETPLNGIILLQTPCFINGNTDYPIYGKGLYVLEYFEQESSIHILAAPTPAKWTLSSNIKRNESVDFGSLVSVRSVFGDMDSQIANVAMSVTIIEDSYGAFFVIEQTAYQINASAEKVSQEAFIKLLISICEAPHPEKENLIDLILET